MPTAHPLERIYDGHAQALFGFLLAFTRDEQDTRDALQEVFRRLAERPGLLDGARDPRAFLLRMARNQAVDLMRRRASRDRRASEQAAEPATLFEPAPDPGARELREGLDRALAGLPAEQREVVHLKLWEGLTFEHIADVLGISPNTAASRYRYGIDKLRDRLRPLYEEIKSHG